MSNKFYKFLTKDKPLVCCTAYDYRMAKLIDEAGFDLVLIGDSLGNVVRGEENTLSVTVDDIVYHCKMVRRAVKKALVVADMPFLSCSLGYTEAIKACARMIQEGGADAVKIEGDMSMAPVIQAIVEANIPVVGHVGLKPQAILTTAGYRVQGKDIAGDNSEMPVGIKGSTAEEILKDAKSIQDAGAFCIVIEGVPSRLGKMITDSLQVPTIGTGAGPHCSGQLLVLYDMLGFCDRSPKFARRYISLNDIISGALNEYKSDVETKAFPSEKESY